VCGDYVLCVVCCVVLLCEVQPPSDKIKARTSSLRATTPQHHNTQQCHHNTQYHDTASRDTTTPQHHNIATPQHHNTTTPQHQIRHHIKYHVRHNTTTPQITLTRSLSQCLSQRMSLAEASNAREVYERCTSHAELLKHIKVPAAKQVAFPGSIPSSFTSTNCMASTSAD
jgi:hypothetical protein